MLDRMSTSEHSSTDPAASDTVGATATMLTIPARFCGPPASGNGGWTAGAFAQVIGSRSDDGWAPVEVTLRQPPPLDDPLAIARTDDGWALRGEQGEVATARVLTDPVTDQPEPLTPVDVETARSAMTAYVGATGHPFPTCFVCGTGRAEGDGLRIFPGRIADADDGSMRVASTWTPHASHAADAEPGTASLPVTWGALDCAGAWAADFGERLLVLGRMTARVRRLPRVGRVHVVVGQVRGRDGRKTFAATSIFDEYGDQLGSSEQTWISVQRDQFSD